MIVNCSNETFCVTSLIIEPGQMLTEAARKSGWQVKRQSQGKEKIYCPDHKR